MKVNDFFRELNPCSGGEGVPADLGGYVQYEGHLVFSFGRGTIPGSIVPGYRSDVKRSSNGFSAHIRGLAFFRLTETFVGTQPWNRRRFENDREHPGFENQGTPFFSRVFTHPAGFFSDPSRTLCRTNYGVCLFCGRITVRCSKTRTPPERKRSGKLRFICLRRSDSPSVPLPSRGIERCPRP